jgi:hypothetical protein
VAVEERAQVMVAPMRTRPAAVQCQVRAVLVEHITQDHRPTLEDPHTNQEVRQALELGLVARTVTVVSGWVTWRRSVADSFWVVCFIRSEVASVEDTAGGWVDLAHSLE